MVSNRELAERIAAAMYAHAEHPRRLQEAVTMTPKEIRAQVVGVIERTLDAEAGRLAPRDLLG